MYVYARSGPYMAVHWASGLLAVSATTLCVSSGTDVFQLLSNIPLFSITGESTAQFISSNSSCVAGAMVTNTVLLPLRIVVLARYGDTLFGALADRRESYRRALIAYHRTQLKRERVVRDGKS